MEKHKSKIEFLEVDKSHQTRLQYQRRYEVSLDGKLIAVGQWRPAGVFECSGGSIDVEGAIRRWVLYRHDFLYPPRRRQFPKGATVVNVWRCQVEVRQAAHLATTAVAAE